ncbi:9647_t:CDS:1 [Funneliformis caledonium]|uniref:9647_t:CDS:1 n=1 Tax=Funneliformis caledonium TaxID=1117310 RepID=A0A9N9CCK4_9GLOM|nr:9647_t:CDS:1 [Funneliformis caledonium]
MSKIEGPLQKRVASQKELTKEIRENADNSEWEKLRTNLVDLSDNTDNLFEIMDEHKKVSVNILNLFEAVLKKLENVVALSVYRDFISFFVEEIEKKLGNEVWVVVRSAINRKRKFKKMNFKKDEIEFISKLEKTLSSVKMSVEEFELLMNLKTKSNAEFHKSEDQDPKIVKQQLETTLPDELQDFKNR